MTDLFSNSSRPEPSVTVATRTPARDRASAPQCVLASTTVQVQRSFVYSALQSEEETRKSVVLCRECAARTTAQRLLTSPSRCKTV